MSNLVIIKNHTHILKAMLKDKQIISETSSFFSKNNGNKAIDSIMRTVSRLHIRSSHIGIEKQGNCKLTSVQVFELLLLFPFFMVKNALSYSHSGLAGLFNCKKDMFYRFMEQDVIDWRNLVYTLRRRDHQKHY